MKRIILFPILFISIFAFSQNIRLKTSLNGTISDAKTSEVLPFVNIIVEKNGEMVAGTQSDFDGMYNFRNLKPGLYTIKTSYMGYESTMIAGVEITNDKVHAFDIKLNGQAVAFLCCSCCCYPVIEIEEEPIDLIAEQDSINKKEDKLLPSTGFSSSFIESDFTAYPNPTLGLMTLTNVPKTDEMLLFDLTGKIVRTIHLVDDRPITLDLSQFESGMYFLKYTEFGQQKTKKLIRQ